MLEDLSLGSDPSQQEISNLSVCLSAKTELYRKCFGHMTNINYVIPLLGLGSYLETEQFRNIPEGYILTVKPTDSGIKTPLLVLSAL